ncbi:TIGR04282 family arsenosugar biosynthesis glycosyltransferase [Dokdonia sinensis]|uniref:TIGR04282 family arsenosugar biosynthesis glycosyltransferase n=1 Tax=Dokdonia sinensis TaxID=2479847 RepID=UPI0013751BFD|nr:DUF2064 domain-containing protein [Dokdonia sinensis]
MALFEELNRQTIETVEDTGLPYFHFSEKEQVGDSFGDRLTHALSQVYAQGFENVIAIGNDTPHLSAGHILSAVAQLETSALVLGPSTDGGFYLMGLRRSHFRPEQFKNLPWQSAQLSEVIMSTLSRKRNSFNPQLLPTLSDIDTLADVAVVAQKKATLSPCLYQILKNILSRTLVLALSSFERFFESLTKAHFNKGSPQFACS